MKRVKRWYRKNKSWIWDLIGAAMIIGSIPMLYVYVSILQAFVLGR